MGIEKKKHKIGPHTYELTLFGARQGKHVLLRLLKCIAPSGLQALSGRPGGVVAAVAQLFDRIKDEDLDYFIDVYAEKTCILQPTETKAGPGVLPIPLLDRYDDHFGRRYSDAMAWLVWCTLENFADFLGDAKEGSLAERFRGLLDSISPKKSIGGFGDSPQTGE